MNINQAIVLADGTELQPDKEYRLLILLQRTDRPHYWSPFCLRCGENLHIDLLKCEIQAISDLVEMETGNNIAIGITCPGRYCRTKYYFKLN